MEYLTLVGGELRSSLSQSLGDWAPFFWSAAAPILLAIFWLGGIYILWQSWLPNSSVEETGGGLLFRLFFSFFIVAMILCAGAGFEHLVLGEGLIHARVLGGVIDVIRPQ
ncbi:MAG: hypothetical protein HKO65_04500 [Gemmatimonadetes bacterium]|nr:hypothetical protein [Gemmatimonadota bacterium]NNM04340.1 hypothetical protein [Gemmatimonadota bacterium]